MELKHELRARAIDLAIKSYGENGLDRGMDYTFWNRVEAIMKYLKQGVSQ